MAGCRTGVRTTSTMIATVTSERELSDVHMLARGLVRHDIVATVEGAAALAIGLDQVLRVDRRPRHRRSRMARAAPQGPRERREHLVARPRLDRPRGG